MPNQEAGLENLKPAVRLEEILDGQDIEPATRIEAILEGEDITPATRLEYFLKKAVGGNGQSSYTLIASGEISANTTSTSAQGLSDTLTIPEEAVTSEKLLYVRIRDKAGPRRGYHYGNDCFLSNPYPAAGSPNSNCGSIGTICYQVQSDNIIMATGPIAYGVSVNMIQPSENKMLFNARYNSSSTGTINATYVVNVYLLDFVDNISPFIIEGGN